MLPLWVSQSDDVLPCCQGVPVPYLKVEDLDNATFDLFRKYAKRSGRMEDADLVDDNHGLLEKLRLYEGDYLKRAAALLFHPDPEPKRDEVPIHYTALAANPEPVRAEERDA